VAAPVSDERMCRVPVLRRGRGHATNEQVVARGLINESITRERARVRQPKPAAEFAGHHPHTSPAAARFGEHGARFSPKLVYARADIGQIGARERSCAITAGSGVARWPSFVFFISFFCSFLSAHPRIWRRQLPPACAASPAKVRGGKPRNEGLAMDFDADAPGMPAARAGGLRGSSTGRSGGFKGGT